VFIPAFLTNFVYKCVNLVSITKHLLLRPKPVGR